MTTNTIDLYHTPKAIEYRKKLGDIQGKLEEEQYKLFVLQKEAKEISEEYAEYLGLKEKEKKEDVKKS